MSPHELFSVQLRHDDQVTIFHISLKDSGGWIVHEENNRGVIRDIHYDDWHRVERARSLFALKARQLRDHGWIEA
jgi:hypothetical protein